MRNFSTQLNEFNLMESDKCNKSYLKNLGSPEHALNPVLVQVGHTFVHELKQDLKVLVVSALQDDNQLTIQSWVGE